MGDEISDGPINSFVNLVVTQIRMNPPRIIKIQAIRVMEVGRSFISFFLLCPISTMYQVIEKALRRPLSRDYAADLANRSRKMVLRTSHPKLNPDKCLLL